MRPWKPFRHKALAIAALLAAGVAVFGPARRATAWIVFDPWAFGEHVQQVAQLGQQISSAVQEVQNQVKELTHLSLDATPNDSAMIAGIQSQLDSSLYSAPDPASQLNSRYPADMSSLTWDQYQSDQSTWTADERQAVIENRSLENQVYRDMATTQQQVGAIVDGSNSAPGETAAIQAHNDLLAVASGELSKLQALRAARSRLVTERLARRQSELSFAAAEQARVRADWNDPAPPTQTVVDPFQN